MKRLPAFFGAVVFSVFASTMAEGLFSPLLKPVLTGPRDMVLVNTLGDFVAAIAAICAFLFIESKRPTE